MVVGGVSGPAAYGSPDWGMVLVRREHIGHLTRRMDALRAEVVRVRDCADAHRVDDRAVVSQGELLPGPRTEIAEELDRRRQELLGELRDTRDLRGRCREALRRHMARLEGEADG